MERKVILAIDDNEVQLKMYHEMLSPKYDLRAVKVASEAMNFLNSNKIDLILLDIEMPNISGFEFLEDIRKIPSYMTVPIIIISGHTERDFMEKAKNSPASGVLTKPVVLEVLVETIEKALKEAV
jgi:CheY-like chemotaxis protein